MINKMFKKIVLICLLLTLVTASLGCSSSVNFNTNYNMQEEHYPQPPVHEERFSSDETSFYTPEGWHVEVKENGFFEADTAVKETEDLENIQSLRFNWQGKEVEVSGFTLTDSKDGHGNPCYWLGSQSNSAYNIMVSRNRIEENGEKTTTSSFSGKTGIEEGVLIYDQNSGWKEDKEITVIVSENI